MRIVSSRASPSKPGAMIETSPGVYEHHIYDWVPGAGPGSDQFSQVGQVPVGGLIPPRPVGRREPMTLGEVYAALAAWFESEQGVLVCAPTGTGCGPHAGARSAGSSRPTWAPSH